MKRDYHIIWHNTIDSTNSEAARRISDIDNLSVIAARRQTAGRGQRGNTWHSAPGKNLTFSLTVKWGRDGVPDIRSKDQFTVCRTVTLALTAWLEAKGICSMIKWPNDIYVNDRKICGILIENRMRGEYLSESIIGIGLNVNEAGFPAYLPNPVSVREETGAIYDLDLCLEEILVCFDARLDMAETAEGRAKLETLYSDRLYRKNEAHRFIDMVSGQEFTGVICGVSESACLIVRIQKEGGSSCMREFAFKEIAYII